MRCKLPNANSMKEPGDALKPRELERLESQEAEVRVDGYDVHRETLEDD